MAYGPSELNHQAKGRPDHGGDGLLTVGTLDHVQTKRWVANPLCRAPDLSHRPEADGRWPRVVTGENGTPDPRPLTAATPNYDLPYLARTLVWQAHQPGLWLRRTVRAPYPRLHRAGKGPNVSCAPHSPKQT